LFVPPLGRSTPSSDSSPGKLFVGGLSWQTTPDKLRDYFGQFGTVTDVLVMKDPVTQVTQKQMHKNSRPGLSLLLNCREIYHMGI
jgi:RNA recognition motif-containing protein